MAFRGGPQNRRYNEPPLIKLVEQYLLQNKHRSFINLDDMGQEIRRKSFKFSRMKQSVFRELLKRAYHSYSTTTAATKEDFAGDDIEFDDMPLDEKTLKDMEGYPTESDEDSDPPLVEENLDVSKDAGGSQMKNLYMTPSTSVVKNASDKENRATIADTMKDELAASIALVSKSRPGISKAAVDCLSVSSSSSKSDSTTNKPQTTAKVSPEQTKDAEVDSESDLEIIDEVPKASASSSTVQIRVPVSSNVPSSPFAQTPLSNQIQSAKQTVQSPRVGTSANNTPNTLSSGSQNWKNSEKENISNTNAMSNKSTNGPLSNASNRGVKRKPVSKTGDEAETGINEDLTRKRVRKSVPIAVVHDTGYKLSNFAGSEKVVEDVCKLVMHLKHPEIYQTLGVTPPRGFLLHGPPGTGKTLLANAIAGELSMPMLKVAGTELVSGISGESENNIRELFNQAVSVAPCIIFIDEIDSVTPRRETANREMERRIVAQLLACIDDLINKQKGDQVLLIGATNRIESIDTALRRAGRFDREICLGIPDETSREKILSVICREVKMNPDVTTKVLAKLTPGYVGADLQALVREAAVQAVNRKLYSEKVDKVAPAGVNEEAMDVDNSNAGENEKASTQELPSTQELSVNDTEADETPPSLKWIKETASLTPEELSDLFVCMQDYRIALKIVQPSSKREGFATVPDTTWDDIGALHDIRDELQVSILGPVKHAEAFERLGLTTPAGVLLCGPPGCGKTLLAKAVANEAGINFISVKGPELLNMYVGESERAVRQCFLRARNSSPCVIFFDELDALCPRRSDFADSSSGSGGRIVNQLLTEMDGIESRQGVFVMAATNRPDIIDPAVLRPGRLDKILFVNLPTPKDRLDILKALTKNSAKPSLAEDVNLEEIANSPECEDYTGADLAALVREASIAAFRELVLLPKDEPCSINDLKVSGHHFKTAFTKTKPSVGKEDRLKYKRMAEKYSSIR